MKCVAVWRLSSIAAVLLLANGCGLGSGADFTLSNLKVASNHTCPSGATNAPYDLQATIDSHNGSSSAVSIKAVTAVMTLAGVQGGWLQQVGYRYDAGNVAFAPDRVGAGSATTIRVTVPSACTNPSTSGRPPSYGDYAVALTVTTSAGTFKLASKNRHRILAS